MRHNQIARDYPVEVAQAAATLKRAGQVVTVERLSQLIRGGNKAAIAQEVKKFRELGEIPSSNDYKARQATLAASKPPDLEDRIRAYQARTVRPGDMVIFRIGDQNIVIRRRRSQHGNRLEIQAPPNVHFHVIRQTQKGDIR